jgi:hypothetical protein
MYCIQCGVKLADTEKQCPLCGTVVFHPDLPRPEAEPLYPPTRQPTQVSHHGMLVIVTTLFLLPILICLLCNLQFSNAITWSGYVTGALLVAYVSFVLPRWFRKPNPVIFLPCALASAVLYVLYIDIATQGGWFLSLAFPVMGYIAAVVVAVVTLLRYVKKGYLYIFGGASIALGLLMPLMEFLIFYTFDLSSFLVWSFYPLIVLVLFGLMLIFLALCHPARESMERRFFI